MNDKTRTTDATQTTITSILVPQNATVMARISFMATQSDFSASMGGYYFAVFRRASGDVTRIGSNLNQAIQAEVVSDFSGTHPSIDIVANTGTQAIDFKVTGKAATTIDWFYDLDI